MSKRDHTAMQCIRDNIDNVEIPQPNNDQAVSNANTVLAEKQTELMEELSMGKMVMPPFVRRYKSGGAKMTDVMSAFDTLARSGLREDLRDRFI